MRFLRLGCAFGVLIVSAACGTSEGPSSGSPSPDEPAVTPHRSSVVEPAATPATAAPSPVSTTDAPSTLTDVKVYLLRGERLAIAHREVPGPATLRGALTELLAGPTSGEQEAGLHSEVPSGTMLLDVSLTDGLATVDLSGAYEHGGGTLSMTARIAQVVFTATQFDNSERVLFWMDGQPIEFLGGEGIVLDESVERMHVDRALTGGIIIDTPLPGTVVTSPITVIGEGDVFEADFPIIVRRDGIRIAGPVLGVAGAWGEWAEFEAVVNVDVGPGPIEIVAWDEQGCTPGDPECSPVIESVVPLFLAE